SAAVPPSSYNYIPGGIPAIALSRRKRTVGLDLGTSRVAVVIADSDDSGPHVIGVGESPSEGLRKGVVVNIDKTVQAIQAAAVQNVIKCVHGAGFDIEDVVCSGLAAGESVLTRQEIELGVCLIQIGAGTTDVVIYNDSAGRHLAVLPVGGNHVTSDIAIGLR